METASKQAAYDYVLQSYSSDRISHVVPQVKKMTCGPFRAHSTSELIPSFQYFLYRQSYASRPMSENSHLTLTHTWKPVDENENVFDDYIEPERCQWCQDCEQCKIEVQGNSDAKSLHNQRIALPEKLSHLKTSAASGIKELIRKISNSSSHTSQSVQNDLRPDQSGLMHHSESLPQQHVHCHHYARNRLLSNPVMQSHEVDTIDIIVDVPEKSTLKVTSEAATRSRRFSIVQEFNRWRKNSIMASFMSNATEVVYRVEPVDLRPWSVRMDPSNHDDRILDRFLTSDANQRRDAICERIDKLERGRSLLGFMEFLLRENYINNFLI